MRALTIKALTAAGLSIRSIGDSSNCNKYSISSLRIACDTNSSTICEDTFENILLNSSEHVDIKSDRFW